jgi:hypothetical protein
MMLPVAPAVEAALRTHRLHAGATQRGLDMFANLAVNDDNCPHLVGYVRDPMLTALSDLQYRSLNFD